MVKSESRRTRSRLRTAPSLGRFGVMVTVPVSRRGAVVMTPATPIAGRAAPPAPHRDPKVVRQAEKVFAEMGMTPAEAVSLFYKQTALHGGFPITELIPNEETRAALREPPESLVSYASVDEMIADLWRDA